MPGIWSIMCSPYPPISNPVGDINVGPVRKVPWHVRPTHFALLVVWAGFLLVLLSGTWGWADDGFSTIHGTVRFPGAVPPPTIVNVLKDPEHCGAQVAIQSVKVQGSAGALEGAIVSLEGMFPMKELPANPDRPVVNAHCAFIPRVIGAQTGQDVEVRNQDPILHNTHIKLGKRTFLNVAQVPNGRPIMKMLKQPGHYSIKCDKHTFMEGHLVVFSHPFFSVTDSSGSFHLAQVPPGTYQLQVWHETLGYLTQPLEIAAQSVRRLDLVYP